MAIAVFPFLLLIVGILLYFISANGKVQEVARIMIFCGMFVLTYVLAGHTVRLL